MKKNPHQLRQLSLIPAVIVTATLHSYGGIIGLGDLSGGTSYSVANDMSDNGSVIIGSSQSPSGGSGFYWTDAGGMMWIGDVVGGGFDGQPNAVSGNGLVIVGEAEGPGSEESGSVSFAYRWTSSDGVVNLGDLPGGDDHSQASAVSQSGSVVVGSSQSSSGLEAFRWTSSGGMTGLGDLPGGWFESEATGVSNDGAVVVGTSVTASGREAFRWTDAEGMVGLGTLPGDLTNTHGAAVSGDGQVIVGSASHPFHGSQAIRWTSATGLVGLGSIPGSSSSTSAKATNSDGSVVVGRAGLDIFYWTSEGGMQSLTDLLTAQGDDLSHWNYLFDAAAVSGDGQTIVGYGQNSSGRNEVFIATLNAATVPEPSGFLLASAGCLVLMARARRRSGCRKKASRHPGT